jgi:hypothetical protein
MSLLVSKFEQLELVYRVSLWLRQMMRDQCNEFKGLEYLHQLLFFNDSSSTSLTSSNVFINITVYSQGSGSSRSDELLI